MPLKLTCKHCGELMYHASGIRPNGGPRNNQYYSNLFDLSVPDIVDQKLNFKCPGCGRTISSRDLEAWTIEISGVKKVLA